MKKLLKRLMPVTLSIAAILPVTSAFADEIAHVYPPFYKLTETTPLYNSPVGIPEPAGASISPQTVKVLDSYESTQSNPQWYKIDTWLGLKWINAGKGVQLASPEPVPFSDTDDPNTKFGAMWGRTDYRTFLELRRVTNVYNKAGDSTPIAAIAPQTLEVKAAYGQYSTPWGTWYLAATWLGDKWLYAIRPLIRDVVSANPVIFPVKMAVSSNVYGTGEGLQGQLYDDAYEDTKTNYALAPQEVEVIDEANGFLKIRTWVGDKWVKRNVHWTNAK